VSTFRADGHTPIGRPGNLKAVGAAVFAAAAALGWWALWHEPRSVRLRRRTVRPPRWPRTLDGLTVAVVADLHTGAPHVDVDRVRRVVSRLNRRGPDLVALLGDYADPEVAFGTAVEVDAVAAALGDLRAPLGRYAVLGNHDWHAHGSAMPRALAAAGITVLENDAVRVDGAGAPLWVAGVADAVTRTPRLEQALAVVPADHTVVLLTHNPDVFPLVPTRVALTLAGHTHGAQVDLPVVRERTTPSRHGAHYTNGHQVEGGRHLFVSPGVGTSRFPIRFRARPEVTLLRLDAGA
jgi:predicted MPP superfamily phosphohydrolase